MVKDPISCLFFSLVTKVTAELAKAQEASSLQAAAVSEAASKAASAEKDLEKSRREVKERGDMARKMLAEKDKEIADLRKGGSGGVGGGVGGGGGGVFGAGSSSSEGAIADHGGRGGDVWGGPGAGASPPLLGKFTPLTMLLELEDDGEGGGGGGCAAAPSSDSAAAATSAKAEAGGVVLWRAEDEAAIVAQARLQASRDVLAVQLKAEVAHLTLTPARHPTNDAAAPQKRPHATDIINRPIITFTDTRPLPPLASGLVKNWEG
jgi:hypothetical protein